MQEQLENRILAFLRSEHPDQDGKGRDSRDSQGKG
jgi:hypothetical protein